LQAFDAVFFIAANKDGYYFIAGTERRHHGVINGLCYIAVCHTTGHKETYKVNNLRPEINLINI
jgi:hypothetical protein